MQPDFLIDAYQTERLKTLGVWAQISAPEFDWRPERRARTPHEHLVHQCLSEDSWMTRMLGIQLDQPPLPPTETLPSFLAHYGAASALRLERLRAMDDGWFDEGVAFFDVPRSRAWVLVRRLVHTAHHRGQLTALLRWRGQALYSTYGPTADTGGLPAHGATVIYPPDPGTTEWPPLPGPGTRPATERPAADR